MTLWLITFCVSVLFFIVAYVSNIGVLSDIPALFVFLVIISTFIHIFHRTRMIVAGPISSAFLAVLAMAIFFLCKQVIVSGDGGATLAVKILLYHFVFMAGLLVGYYDPSVPSSRAWIYALMIFFLPLLFFVLFALGRPPSAALSVFNRNSFAGFTLTASAVLIGFGTGRPLVSLPVYVAIVSFSLLINTTLGALLAFLLTVVLYIGPRSVLNPRVFLSVILLGVVGFGAFAYLLSNPEVLQSIAAIERLQFVFGNLSNLFRDYSGSWLDLDMATAVRFAPSSELDMSAIFRIIHWINILSTLAAEWPGAIWIGGGTDWIHQNQDRLTYRLAAHNEYVRLTAEQGLFNSLLIFAGLYAVAFSVRRSPLFIPLFATTVYLGSENLLNNFVATAMYFFMFGHTFAAERRRKLELATKTPTTMSDGHQSELRIQ